MSHGQRGEIVGNQQSGKQRRSLRGERFRLHNVSRHARLIRLQRRTKRLFVSCGDQLHGDIGKGDAASIVHNVMRIPQWIVPRRKRRAKRNIVKQMGDIGKTSVERIRRILRGEIDAEAQQRRGASPRVGADRDGNGAPHAGDVEGADEGAALVSLGVDVGEPSHGRGGVFLNGGLALREGERRFVIVVEFPRRERVPIVCVIQRAAVQMREGHVYAQGYPMSQQLFGGVVMIVLVGVAVGKELGRHTVGEVHGVTGLDLEVDNDLGEEEETGRGAREEGDEPARDGPFADAIDGFGEGVE
mmetsp:Transcript_31540/g.66786  ORF Transcript_31540/g.66786 Transcript_31540/m.66786 type:complete len:301 (+) Transcript_31540:567-1469(+)